MIDCVVTGGVIYMSEVLKLACFASNMKSKSVLCDVRSNVPNIYETDFTTIRCGSTRC